MTDTADGVHERGHRAFVGGGGEFWDRISLLQFDFLISEGLKPNHTFLDVACGSLRGGSRFIAYLERGRYLGLDKHIELVIYDVACELGIDLYRDKRPRFAISDRFEFEKLGAKPDFALAQSLFTHLNEPDIRLCLTKLRQTAPEGCRFFATFFETMQPLRNPEHSHSHAGFRYSREEMEDFGKSAGWTPRYIGRWNHPRRQHIIKYQC